MHINSIIIAVVFLITGFIAAYSIFHQDENNSHSDSPINIDAEDSTAFTIVNPFVEKNIATKFDNHFDSERLDFLEHEIVEIKQQLQAIKQNLAARPDTTPAIAEPVKTGRTRPPSFFSSRLYNLDNLIRGGISSSLAEDIVRRKNSIELKRLALQDRAKRENYFNTQRYFDELDKINQQDVSLREELGAERYDEYLFTSKQNNRIRISSVMLGSAAEQSGIQKGDVVLSYDNKRMFAWQELKEATTEGQLGEFVSISIYRNGEIYSFTVPRGPLGIQLGATRLEP